jgi:hypothetical protein
MGTDLEGNDLGLFEVLFDISSDENKWWRSVTGDWERNGLLSFSRYCFINHQKNCESGDILKEIFAIFYALIALFVPGDSWVKPTVPKPRLDVLVCRLLRQHTGEQRKFSSLLSPTKCMCSHFTYIIYDHDHHVYLGPPRPSSGRTKYKRKYVWNASVCVISRKWS